MKKDIYYRPELVKQMNKILKTVVTLYESNFLAMYYGLLAKKDLVTEDNAKEYFDDNFVEKYADKNSEIGKRSLFLKEVADCLKDRINGYDKFIEQYEDKMVNEYHVKSISEAKAANYVFQFFQNSINELGEKMIESANPSLTPIETFMIHDFIKQITSPMRNPNIQIPEGETKCWYDRYPHNDYRSDLNQSVEWIKEHANNIIEIFDTPDKEAENEKEEYDEAELE